MSAAGLDWMQFNKNKSSLSDLSIVNVVFVEKGQRFYN